MIKVKTALISVSDKKGIIPFAKGLHKHGVHILSTGGTAKAIRDAGIPVQDVSDYTGYPEMMDGRVKTLHPKIHGGLLAVRDNEDHMAMAKKHNIGLIDMVVVNLYPFESVIKRKTIKLAEAIENIDIGGPGMLRSAAKNYKSVAVICNPDRYSRILEELDTNNGILPDGILYNLAIEAFSHTHHYDGIISQYLLKRNNGDDFNQFPDAISLKFTKVQDLRYGENPHQQGSFYKVSSEDVGIGKAKKLHGKELSFNNILDINAALEFIKDFDDPAAVIIKHNNPTGLAQAATIDKAFKDAWSVDKISAFGGIIGLNKKVDLKTAKLISESGFMECVIAPGFEKKAFELLSKKKNVRLLEIDLKQLVKSGWDMKTVQGGLLVQDKDQYLVKKNDLQVASKKKPTKSQIASMLFGFKAIKNIRSNAIILVKGTSIIGIGCGQTSRIEAVKIAIKKAGKLAKGSIMISDAFLPHIDNVQHAAKAGISAIIQTGGSVADSNVIKEADKKKIVMVMTGTRHFKH